MKGYEMSKSSKNNEKNRPGFFNRLSKAGIYASVALASVGVGRALVDDYSQYEQTGEVMGSVDYAEKALNYTIETPKNVLELL